MKDEEEFRTGIFSCGEKDYTFALKNFKFLIMDPSKESINFLPNRESSSLFSDEQGAIYGSTYDAHSIAIYAPNFKCNIDGYRTSIILQISFNAIRTNDNFITGMDFIKGYFYICVVQSVVLFI